MTVIVKWTDGALKQHETAIADYRVSKKIVDCGVCYAKEIVRMCLNDIVKEGIMSIDEIWYEEWNACD